jgi:hypothetical protein
MNNKMKIRRKRGRIELVREKVEISKREKRVDILAVMSISPSLRRETGFGVQLERKSTQ